MRRNLFPLLAVAVLISVVVPPALAAPATQLQCVEEELSPIAAIDRASSWAKTFESLAGIPDLTKEQVVILEQALKLGTPRFFSARPGTAEWAFAVEAPSNALLNAASTKLPAEVYAAVWVRFQLVPGASRFAESTPICNCSNPGGSCTLGGITGTCSRTACVTCGGTYTGVCSV